MSFGQRLRALRRSAGKTIEELAEASGVSGRAISDMERGYSQAPQTRTLAALADALRLDEAERDGLVELARSGRSDNRAGRPRVGETPRGVSDFVGRVRELGLLGRHAEQASVDRPAVVVVVHGQPGLGKTALAIRAAEQLRDRFPDGLLYVDLRGTDAVPMPAGEALARLLRALQVNPRDIADDEQDRASQLRSVLQERRCLLVLDNAAHEQQVRLLLPGIGAVMVVVTSRRALGGLEDVVRIGLAPLTATESAQLLQAIAGQASRRAAAADIGAVAKMCGNLPLALRIAGTRLASRPDWTMGHLAQRLLDADRRLANLTTGDMGVEAAFALSYAQLAEPAKSMFRRLAHVPGLDFAAALAAVLTAPDEVLGRASVFAAEDLLEELVELGLLQPHGADRYRFHDLIRLFAAQRLHTEEPAETRAATEHRMSNWLLDTAIVAGRWFEPEFGAPPDTWQGLVPLDTPEQAQGWLQAEAEHWIAAFRAAAAAGRDQLVVDVAEAMHWYSDRAAQRPYWLEIYRSSRAAAARLPDRRQEVNHINYAAWAAAVVEKRYAESASLALEAYRLAEQLGDAHGQASALQYAGDAWRQADKPEEALHTYRRAQVLADAVGGHDRYVQIGCGLGHSLRMLGRTDEALDQFRAVLTAIDERPVAPAPAQVARAVAHVAMARTLADAQRWQEALGQASVALPLASEFGSLRLIGTAHVTLGRAYAALGSADIAREHFTCGIKHFEDGHANQKAIAMAKSALAALDG
ncbi:MAG: helix-turn-helix domain-containing protein [Hamadaea sp.]|nr:helix-turn-helix domain-containing protein [Hamadaea sp.]